MRKEKTECRCETWKRRYMEVEHTRRKHARNWEKDLCHLSSIISDRDSTITILKAELKHSRNMSSAQRKVIQQMQDSGDNIPTDAVTPAIKKRRTMSSLTNCLATDDEICPLSLAPINKSPSPLSDDERPCPLVLNLTKPEYKCAELVCGHRFNSAWLVYHFIERSTFRCPLCRTGKESFRFQIKDLPPGMMQMLDEVNAMKKRRAQQMGAH